MSPVRASQLIQQLNRWVGRTVSWLTLLMVVVMFALVALRYWFDTGWIWMQESVTWMHAAVFLLGAAYTLNANEHVRVDIFYRSMSPRRQAWTDAVGTVAFLFPLTLCMLWISWDYVSLSWSIKESSPEAGGLPYPWVPLLKSLIPMASALLLLQGIAILLNSVATIRQRS